MPRKQPEQKRVIVFDTETDSLIANTAVSINKQPRIIELFAQILEQKGEGKRAKFKELGRYSQLFSIGKPIPQEVVNITGIKDADLIGAPPFREKAAEVAELMQSADRVVAHNLSYDLTVTDFEMARCSLPRIKWPERICTVEATEYFFGYRLNLTTLYKTLFDETFADAHRAEADVMALSRCYQELVKRRVI